MIADRALARMQSDDSREALDGFRIKLAELDLSAAKPISIPVTAASTPAESPPSDSTRGLTAEKPKLVYAPHPAYPLSLDKMRVTGSGRFKITFDGRGNARSVKIVQSTGNHTLDSNTINTLKLWRAAPGTLNSAPPASVRFLGNALRAAITQNIKPARPRGERVRVPYQGMECRFNWTAAILSLARSPVLRITSKTRHESVVSKLT